MRSGRFQASAPTVARRSGRAYTARPMVIGRDFAWAHLAKAGGEMTHAMFNLFPELVEFADPPHTVVQHTSFEDRAEQLAGKQRVLNIRRLPSWMLSFHVWKSMRGLLPDFTSSPMLSPHQIADSNIADEFLARYRPPGGGIDVWLRTDRLIDDFLAFAAQRTEVTEERRAAVRALPRVNELAYDRAVDHWFTSAHIRLMYLRNPEWAAAEAFVYGDTLAA